MSQPYGDWIGRSETLHDVATPFPFIALNATLDRDDVDAMPAGDEPVFRKELPNGFTNPGLHKALQAYGRTNLIITGFMTHMCVDSTTRAAVDLGYGVTIVENAVASRALPGAIGKPARSAQEVHDGTLAHLADLFAVVVPDASALTK